MAEGKEHRDPNFDLIAKSLSGNATAQDQKALKEWLALDIKNQKEFDRIKRVWDSSASYIEVDTNRAWMAMEERMAASDKVVGINTISTTFWKMRIAASIVLFLGLSFYFFYPWDEVQYVSQGKPLVADLADGSTISLNSNSKLTVEGEFNGQERKVRLKGEAFFDIAKDPEKPFIIETDLVQVQVLGTSFNVMESEDSVVVMVKTGKVEVRDFENAENNIQLVKDQKIVFRKNQKKFEEALVDMNEMAWKTRTIIFRRTLMKNVIQVLEKTYNQKFELANPNIELCEFTAQFEDQSLEEVLEVISVALNLRFSIEEDKIVLAGEGCE